MFGLTLLGSIHAQRGLLIRPSSELRCTGVPWSYELALTPPESSKRDLRSRVVGFRGSWRVREPKLSASPEEEGSCANSVKKPRSSPALDELVLAGVARPASRRPHPRGSGPHFLWSRRRAARRRIHDREVLRAQKRKACSQRAADMHGKDLQPLGDERPAGAPLIPVLWTLPRRRDPPRAAKYGAEIQLLRWLLALNGGRRLSQPQISGSFRRRTPSP